MKLSHVGLYIVLAILAVILDMISVAATAGSQLAVACPATFAVV